MWFSFTKANRRVTCYYFYLWDEDFGPAFVKVCAYFPYPMKIWVNGHEWAKRQATKTGIGFTELSNGFATCTDPVGLQAICDRLGPGVITVFAERWWSILPLPLTDADRAAGYRWELSMRQVETSRTLVFDAPRHARGFFEALVADNLDIGRPELIELIFRRGQRRGRPAAGQFKTKVVTYGTEVNVNAFWLLSTIDDPTWARQQLCRTTGTATQWHHHRDRHSFSHSHFEQLHARWDTRAQTLPSPGSATSLLVMPEAVTLAEILCDPQWRRHVAIADHYDLLLFYRQVARRLGQPTKFSDRLA